jgi:hypothetical protein
VLSFHSLKKNVPLKKLIAMLMMYPYQIVTSLTLLLLLDVFSFFLASKNKSNTRFLLWGAIILFVPFVGALICILSHYAGKREIKAA